jgi:hypothetical protein
MQKGVILGCGNRSNAGMDTVTLMTFWIATISPYKYAKSQLPYELIAFKTP